jgi:DNA-binding XRE family transcriptional regulator
MKGKEFEVIRCRLDLTQKQLAKKLKLSAGTIVSIESSQEVKKVYELAILRLQDESKIKNGDVKS